MNLVGLDANLLRPNSTIRLGCKHHSNGHPVVAVLLYGAETGGSRTPVMFYKEVRVGRAQTVVHRVHFVFVV